MTGGSEKPSLCRSPGTGRGTQNELRPRITLPRAGCAGERCFKAERESAPRACTGTLRRYDIVIDSGTPFLLRRTMPRPVSLSPELLQTFVEVIRHDGDAVAAAKTLGINQPSMSKRLAQLQHA